MAVSTFVTASQHTARLALAVLIGTLFAGCFSSAEPAPVVGKLHGVVTFKGVPVEEGKVVFEDPTQGQLAAADLNSDGSYVVTTAEGGLRVGTYIVTVTPVPVEFDPLHQKVDPLHPPTVPTADAPNIPQKYRSRATSGLSTTVEEGDNTCDIEMTE